MTALYILIGLIAGSAALSIGVWTFIVGCPAIAYAFLSVLDCIQRPRATQAWKDLRAAVGGLAVTSALGGATYLAVMLLQWCLVGLGWA